MEATASADPLRTALAALPTSPALVAVSGGRDSVALLHGLHALGRKKLTVVHLDHRLRGAASAADARFVRRLAAKLGYECVVGRADVRGYAAERGLSLELAARELRHVFFAGVARRTRRRVVLLAHHGDDQVETCLFNFLRGSGAAGLAGMRAESKLALGITLRRPLLGVRRAEIDDYVNRHRLKYREDATNAQLDAARNRLRHGVLPAIRDAVGDAFPDAILRAAEILRAEDEWMRAETERGPLAAVLPLATLRDQPLALQRRGLRRWLEAHGVVVTFELVERVRALADPGATNAKVNLPAGRHCRRRAGVLFVE